MDKLRNHVDILICEQVHIIFKRTHYQTFRTFCSNITKELNGTNVSLHTTSIITAVSSKIKLIFGFSDDESYIYILKFFLDERYTGLEKIVFRIKELFKNSYN